MSAQKRDVPHPSFPENVPQYTVRYESKTYTVLCEGQEILTGDIGELGLRKGDSAKTRAFKVARRIAEYLLGRQ